MAGGETLGLGPQSSLVVRKHDDTCFAVRIVMEPLLFALCAMFGFGVLSAQQTGWQPSPGHTQVAIWPGVVPDAPPIAGPETLTTTANDELVAGRRWSYVSDVSHPTMTVYFPSGKRARFRDT